MAERPNGTPTCDIDNHIASATGLASEWYNYSAADGKRRQVGAAYQEELYLYGAGTGRLATYLWNGTTWAIQNLDIRFAGHLIYQGGDWVAVDRLGSVRYRKGSGVGTRHDYFPYGEEKTVTAQGRDKFATYFRD